MPILGTLASSTQKSFNSFESIATVTVASGGSSVIAFSSIPSTYQHLQLRSSWGFENITNNTWLNVQFNGDSGSNYAYHAIRASGSSSPGISQNFGATKAVFGADDNGDAVIWASSISDILDYSNTSKYKTTRSLAGQDRNGAGAVNIWSSLWMSTSAIGSITIIPDFSTFRQGSIFALYGIKG